jgi:hypothetical protein
MISRSPVTEDHQVDPSFTRSVRAL